MSHKRPLPWANLEEFRGKMFKGEWPTFPELLEIQNLRFGERPCLTDFDGPDGSKRTLTYSQMYEKVLKLANFLVSSGLKKGDHVAVAGKNSPEWAITYLAILVASGVVIPIADSLHDTETGNIIKASTPKFAFLDDGKIPYVKENFPNLIVYSLNPTVPEKFVLNLSASPVTPENQNEKPTEDDLALIMFTSGTTGNPKGVMLTHKNIISDGYIAQTNLLILPTDVFYALLPIHHAYTMQAAFICPLQVGAEIVFGKSLAVTRLMKELREGKISIMLGVPLLYNKLLSGINKGIRSKGAAVYGIISLLRGISFVSKKFFGLNIGRSLFGKVLEQANISTLRVAICGGGPLAKSVFRQYQEMGIDFIQGYGLTETSPIIALNPVEKFKIQSVGRDFSPYEEIKIIENKEFSDVAENIRGGQKIGEICVKGPMVMKGYYNMPKETAEMFTEDGFLKTGDLGWMDKDHYIMLCGRAKNLIVTSGGKNVYPEEVEDSFQLYYDIQQVTVRGYHPKGDSTSEEIEALIYVSDDLYKSLGLERKTDSVQEEIVKAVHAIVSKVNKRLQSYEQITKISLLKEPLEMTPSQKVKRDFVAKIYE
ncbi:MAG: AMP-binding protein [Spirochaetales bacterium]|nr:AMP-binding protein [Spirochaetales bacterium]